MKVLVTGVTGHVGGAIARHLVRIGCEVVGLSRRPCPISGMSRHVQFDIGSNGFVECVRTAVGKCTVVVHAAAALNKQCTARELIDVNCRGCQQTVELAQTLGSQHLVFISSVPVIGLPLRHPISEDHPTMPNTAYHATKLFGEHLVRLASVMNIASTILRIPSPVGPGMPHDRIFSVFVRRALINEALDLAGRGTRRQNYLDVRDLAMAVDLCLRKRMDGLFNIASPTPISNLELARLCIHLLRSKSQIRYTGSPDPEEGVVWDISTTKAAKELGFHSQIAIDESIMTVAEEMRDSCG